MLKKLAAECLKSKDVENLSEILHCNNLVKNLLKILRYIDNMEEGLNE